MSNDVKTQAAITLLGGWASVTPNDVAECEVIPHEDGGPVVLVNLHCKSGLTHGVRIAEENWQEALRMARLVEAVNRTAP